METPQEIEVWYVIPAIRRELAIAMKNNGLKQVEIANLLGITKSAITQYLNNKRASKVYFNSKIKSQVIESVKSIQNKLDTMREMQRILHLARNENVICDVHVKLDKDFENCHVCYEDNLITIKR